MAHQQEVEVRPGRVSPLSFFRDGRDRVLPLDGRNLSPQEDKELFITYFPVDGTPLEIGAYRILLLNTLRVPSKDHTAPSVPHYPHCFLWDSHHNTF